MKRTFLDTGVLIALARGKSREREAALGLVTEPNRVFLASPFLELELLPHARRLKKHDQVALLEEYFKQTERITDLNGLLETAKDVLLELDLGLVDALHIAAAYLTNAEEFITTESPTKPVYRTRFVRVVEFRP